MSLLIKKPIEQNSIVTFRLITGETLLARFESRDHKNITITKPVVANPIQNEQGYGIYYTPFCATVDEAEKFLIPLTSLIMEPMAPRKELAESYIKMTIGLDIPQ